jgi:antitoxin component YwqK of YwqJK toxin-antitoxin module
MNTYLGFLDKASLFSLLLRLHYCDLIKLCKVRNYLYRITCTPHFTTAWNEYNLTSVKTINQQTNDILIEHVDRLGKHHGLSQLYDNAGNLISSQTYVQNQLEGIRTLWYRSLPQQKEIEETYFNNKLNGQLSTWTLNGTLRATFSYKNDKLDGINREYTDDEIILGEFRDDVYYGSYIRWYTSTGSRKQMTNSKARANYTAYYWYDNGVKSNQSPIVNHRIHGDYLVWNRHGTLLDHYVYIEGERVAIVK